MITFESWLRRQKKRNDIVGDLACDFLHTQSDFPEHGNKCNEEHLAKFGAIPAAYKALKAAQKEYEKYKHENAKQ